eukprot:TRINITY_DN26987_c0_g1_i1.p1 TRINITY_DN26987_c0_g1~~TRINITY_DN26987_c0_g1_i1.p1  ORF type:complete len:339 (+),score=26.48 TRINITY_DN26987_c0_g1_i1:171-1187(+)
MAAAKPDKAATGHGDSSITLKPRLDGQHSRSTASWAEHSMSIQNSLEFNDIPVSANEPGPGHYLGEGSQGFSCLGPQQLSKCHSAPSVSMAPGWDVYQKVALGKGSDKVFLGRGSPGFAYNPQIPGCNDGLSTQTTTVGTSKRPELECSLGVDPYGSPGPVYNVRDDPPKMEDRMCYPKDKAFGMSERFKKDKRKGLGPGEYELKDGTFKPETGRSFGISRAAYDKVIRPGYESELQIKSSKGVGPPLWRDIKKEGSRARSFSMADRFPKSGPSQVPGPGLYKQSERDVSKTTTKIGAPLSDCRRPPTGKFGVTLPRKPRLRLGLMMTTAERGCWGYC